LLKLIGQRKRAAKQEDVAKAKREALEAQIEPQLSHIKSVAKRFKTRIKRSVKTGKYSYTSTVRAKKDDKPSK